MCRSISEGGARCAAHTRPRFDAASFGTAEWDEAAAEHASTRSGALALKAIVKHSQQTGDIERMVAAETALEAGARIRQACAETANRVQGVDTYEALAAEARITPAEGELAERMAKNGVAEASIVRRLRANRRDAEAGERARAYAPRLNSADAAAGRLYAPGMWVQAPSGATYEVESVTPDGMVTTRDGRQFGAGRLTTCSTPANDTLTVEQHRHNDALRPRLPVAPAPTVAWAEVKSKDLKPGDRIETRDTRHASGTRVVTVGRVDVVDEPGFGLTAKVFDQDGRNVSVGNADFAFKTRRDA